MSNLKVGDKVTYPGHWLFDGVFKYYGIVKGGIHPDKTISVNWFKEDIGELRFGNIPVLASHLKLYKNILYPDE